MEPNPKRGPVRYRTFALFAAAGVFGAVVFSAPASSQPGGAAVQLPEGPGKTQVEATCASCHGLNLITNYWGESKQGWHDLIGTMVALSKDQADTITTYLSTNFPVKPAPAAVVVKGPVELTDQGVARANARLAPARSALRA